jgi:hypothetical protein
LVRDDGSRLTIVTNTAIESPPYLPADFWSEPFLRHIYGEAIRKNRSPDLILHGVLARIAATVPPMLHIPGFGIKSRAVVLRRQHCRLCGWQIER